MFLVEGVKRERKDLEGEEGGVEMSGLETVTREELLEILAG